MADIAHTYQVGHRLGTRSSRTPARARDATRCAPIRDRYGVEVEGAVDEADVAQRIKEELDQQAQIERNRANTELAEAALLMGGAKTPSL